MEAKLAMLGVVDPEILAMVGEQLAKMRGRGPDVKRVGNINWI